MGAPVRACALVLALLVTLPAAIAQPDEDGDGPDWYRVEILILANRDPEAAISERWPLLPDLKYPEQWLMLDTAPLTESGEREFRLVTVEDSVPPPPIDLMWDRSVDELLREYRNKQLLREPSVELEALVDLQVPRQRIELPPEQRELNSQRRRIQSSAGLEVLFHQAWLQRIESREDALPLIIDGPVQFGDYPELQGSILLYSGRYLHIASDLWLNTGGNYLEQDATNVGWRMPRPPLPVAPEQVADAPVDMPPFKLDIAPDWLALPSALPPGNEAAAEAVDAEASAIVSLDLSESAEAEVKVELEDSDSGELPGHEPVSDEALQAFLEEPAHDYDFRHAVLLQQSRRMRSGELHYIDHPLVSIVVKISRHEFEPFASSDEDSLASSR